MLQHDDGDLLHAEFARGENSGVPRKYAIIAVDQNWIRPAECFDACRDVGDLFAAVCPGVIGPRNQALDRPPFHLDVDVHHGLRRCNAGPAGAALFLLCPWHQPASSSVISVKRPVRRSNSTSILPNGPLRCLARISRIGAGAFASMSTSSRSQ